jgi:hypothetical protein
MSGAGHGGVGTGDWTGVWTEERSDEGTTL